MIARSLRYYVEGVLAVFYGKLVLSFLRDNGLTILLIVAVAAVISLLIYLVVKRFKSSVKAS
jgi:hypothetical protein